MIKINNPKYYLIIYFFLSILLYLNIWLIEFIFLIPLLLYIKLSEKIDLKLLLIIISTTSLINFAYFHPYGIKFLILIVFANLTFYLSFIYLSKYFITKKYSTIIIPSIYFLLFFIFKYTPINNFWINMPSFLNYYPLTIQYFGGAITTYFIILFNLILFDIIDNFKTKKNTTKLKNEKRKKKNSKISNKNKNINPKTNIIILILLIINFFIINTYFFETQPDENNQKIKIVGIQSNLKQSWEERKEKQTQNLDFYINQSEISIEKYNPKIIIWPEYVFTNYIEFNFTLLNELNTFSKNNNITLIVGSIKLENISSNKSKRYNALYIFDGTNKYENYMAYEPVTIFDENAAKMKNNNEKIISQNTSLGLIICYEENFQYIFQKQILENNATLFLIDGNQYFVANSHGQKLTSLSANLRAFENDRYIFRLETSGLTTIINNDGENIINIPNNQLEIAYFEIPIINKKTIYTKYGNIIEIIFTISLISIIILNLIKNIILKKEKN